MTIYAIEDQVYYKLIEYHNPATARAYEGYKAVQASNVAKTRLTKMSSVCWIVVMLVFLMKF